MQIATLGGGCFWCIEAIYQNTKGVNEAISGYSGGETLNPTYQDICQGNTGHIEVVQIHFDENIISYNDILNIFFSIHNPTTLHRQGADIGEQYSSVIYFSDKTQEDIAKDTIERLNKETYNSTIVTKLQPSPIFYKAEDHHQKYYANNTNEGYCQMVISPKLEKFKNEFSSFL